jgi:hypothetical protein
MLSLTDNNKYAIFALNLGEIVVKLPDEVFALLNERSAAKVLGTKSAKGEVHIINVGGAGALDPETIYIGEIFMKVTGQNLHDAKKDGSKVSVLVSKGYQSFEIKASVKDHATSGPVFEKMKGIFASMKFDLKGLWLLKPEEIWNQSPTWDAGRKII